MNYFFIIDAQEEAHSHIRDYIEKLITNPRVDIITSSTNFNDIAGSLIKGNVTLLEPSKWSRVNKSILTPIAEELNHTHELELIIDEDTGQRTSTIHAIEREPVEDELSFTA